MPKVKFGELKNEWVGFLTRWPFQWWVTLTFRNPVKQEVGKERLLQWTRELCVEEHLQVGFVAVFNEQTRGHWHVLMFGRNSLGKSLTDVSVEKWRERWKANAKLRGVYDLTGVSRYLARNFVLKNPDKSEVFFYNRKLLDRLGSSQK